MPEDDTDRSAEPAGRGTVPVHLAPPGDAPRPGGRPASDPRNQRSSTVALLVVAGISTAVGLLPAIPALVLGILALAQQERSPARAATLRRWGWIAYAAGAGLMVLAGIALVVVAGYAASGTT